MKTQNKSMPTRAVCFLLAVVMMAALLPMTPLTARADAPERQVWLYVPAGVYETVEDAMAAMHKHTDQYDAVASLKEDGEGVKVTEYTDEAVDVYPGFADGKLTDTIPSYDVGHMEYSFYGWQRMTEVDGVLTGSEEYATYGSTLSLPSGTTVYAAVYLKRPKTYDVTFRQADGTAIPALSAALIYGADLSKIIPSDEAVTQYVTTPEGFEFTFWSESKQDLTKPRDDGKSYFDGHSTMGDEPLNLWAHFIPKTYMVTYEVRDPFTGELVSTETREVTYGQPLSYDGVTDTQTNLPSEPSVAGYTFTGWQNEEGKGYSGSSPVDFTRDITLTATFVPDDGQIFVARVWYEDDTGAWVDSGFFLPFTGITHQTAVLTEYQLDQLRQLLNDPAAYVFERADEDVIIMPCQDAEGGDPAVVNVYYARKVFTLTVDGDGGDLYVNGTLSKKGFVEIPVYAGWPFTLTGDVLSVTGADEKVYEMTVSKNAYRYEWLNIPEKTPASDLTVRVTGTRLNVNIKIELHLADLVIETDEGQRIVYTQADLEALNKAYAAAYERAAERLSEALGYTVTPDDLRVSDLADETYKRYEAVVSEELALVDPGYSGRAVNVCAADSYTLYKEISGQADAYSTVSVSLTEHKGTTQYVVAYTDVSGQTHTLTEALYLLDDHELGFSAAAESPFEVTVADDGTTVVALCYRRNLYGFIPSVFFGDGSNATEKFEGIPGIDELTTCYGAPLQALAQMHIGAAHAALSEYGYGHEGYRLDEFSSLYALHCKNTGALKDVYTWPAREYGLVIGEYVICRYDLTLHYWSPDKSSRSMILPVTYNTPLYALLEENLTSDMQVFGYDITGFAYDAEGMLPMQMDDTMPAKALEVWVTYTPKTMELLFDAGADDATAPTPEGGKTVTFDAPVGQLPVTTRPGYLFKGWSYVSADGNTVVITSDSVTDAGMLTQALEHEGVLTLTALWEEGPTTFTVQFLYATLDGGYEIDETATMTGVTGITGQTALEALLTYDAEIFAFHVKAGFAEGKRDETSILAGNGSTVYSVLYDRLTYHITVYANGILAGAEGYAYGATLGGQGSDVKSLTVSYVYGADLSGYMASVQPYAAGYAIKTWQRLDWETILSLADENHTVTDHVAYPLWETVKAQYVVDPTWGCVDMTINGEACGQVRYYYQSVYLPVGAELTLKANAPEDENFRFLGWVELKTNTLISRDEEITFTATEVGLSCKALYVYCGEDTTYHLYLDDRNGAILWFGTETFETLDTATREAVIKVANQGIDPQDEAQLFTPEKGFEMISQENGVVWYQTKRS